MKMLKDDDRNDRNKDKWIGWQALLCLDEAREDDILELGKERSTSNQEPINVTHACEIVAVVTLVGAFWTMKWVRSSAKWTDKDRSKDLLWF